MYALFDSQVITLRGSSQLLPREDPMSPQRLPRSLLIKELRYDWVRGQRLSVVTVTARSW
jgi:hypothetical protein